MYVDLHNGGVLNLLAKEFVKKNVKISIIYVRTFQKEDIISKLRYSEEQKA